MRAIIKKVPIPLAGVALALAALGNLLQPTLEVIHVLCGVLAFILLLMLIAKLVFFPKLIREDLQQSIPASVSGTVFMVLMQLSVYLSAFTPAPALALWIAAVVGHGILIVWFSLRFLTAFNLRQVFPTYFICYVGIVVASVTSPTFGMQTLGLILFWFGFGCYMVLLVVMTLRYLKHEIPESARPLFCVFAAPMSLSLVGYVSVAPHPHLIFVAVLLVAAQALLALVLVRLPRLLALPFYPSFAAMTFPFVISATALNSALKLFRAHDIALPFALDVMFYLETTLAILMVAYVLIHYASFLLRRQPTAASLADRHPLPAFAITSASAKTPLAKASLSHSQE